MFARQALPMTWDFAEANPFSGIAASIDSALDRVADVLVRVIPVAPGEARQADARVLGGSRAVLVSTDPPYYDNISYSELSDFFYIWMRRALGSVHGDLFQTLLTPKSDD